tara:strand:- start:43926 stop:45641 length:1716 start_codon:yes stop_codon:yes gene_type:complete
LSVKFIQSRKGASQLREAIKQENQISYFTQSKIQGEISSDYIKEWSQKNYNGNDYFLNWVKSIFKDENFLSFIKYYRNPNPSSKLVNNKIVEPLSRVFFSDDSYFKYKLNGGMVEMPEEIETDINEILFKALLFSHNSIMIHDLQGENDAFRQLLDIRQVVSICSSNNIISEIAYSCEIEIDNVVVDGYIYMNDTEYQFHRKDFSGDILVYPHDLGCCPADYISKEAFSDKDVVRKSIFSYVREELEEYTFLKTLQRMTEPNGALPITTKIKANTTGKKDIPLQGAPMSIQQMTGAKSTEQRTVQGAESVLQAGTIIEVPAVKKTDGSIDTQLAQNFLNFFYLPVESLRYLSERIAGIESSIIATVLGDYAEQNESAKNEKQVSKSFVSKQDVLRAFSKELSRIRENSDFKLLALKYGAENVEVNTFYGSDFFLESQKELYDMFAAAPNTIERRGILNRIAQSRNKFNKDKATRETVLYKLLPYTTDLEFKEAITNMAVSPEVFQMQTRFDYWINMFEAAYGNIVVFWTETETEESAKLITINNLLLNIINESIKDMPIINLQKPEQQDGN